MFHIADVPDGSLFEVRSVRLLSVLVPVRRENAFASGLLETEAHTANSAKEIDEC
jgi:hypothetical protein